MRKTSWDIKIDRRQYQIEYIRGALPVGGPLTNGLYVNGSLFAQPSEKFFGLHRIKYDFVLNSKTITLVGYGANYDLIVDGFYVKHKISAERKVADWSTWVSLLLALLCVLIVPIFSFHPYSYLIAAFSAVVIAASAFSPFYVGWKKLLRSVVAYAIMWAVSIYILLF